MIVYLSDHGESLGEHGEPTHGIFLYGATLDVPLIIAPPSGAFPWLAGGGARGPEGARPGAARGRHADCARPRGPACSVRSGRREPSRDGGRRRNVGRFATPADPSDALAGPVSYGETYYPRFHYNWSELVAVETERWKYVRAPRPELYDVRADPGELHDVAAEHPEIAATLARHLDSMNMERAGSEPTPSKLDPEALARLQALGYVGGADSTSARRTGPRPDPKDGLPLLQELLQAQTDRDAGRLDDALRRLEALTQKDPQNPAVYVTLVVGSRPQKGSWRARSGPPSGLWRSTRNRRWPCSTSRSPFTRPGVPTRPPPDSSACSSLDPENLKALLVPRRDRPGARASVRRRSSFYRARCRGGSASGARPDQPRQRRARAEAACRRGGGTEGGRRARRKQPDLHFNLGVLAEERGQRAVAMREVPRRGRRVSRTRSGHG